MQAMTINVTTHFHHYMLTTLVRIRCILFQFCSQRLCMAY